MPRGEKAQEESYCCLIDDLKGGSKEAFQLIQIFKIFSIQIFSVVPGGVAKMSCRGSAVQVMSNQQLYMVCIFALPVPSVGLGFS